jgi:hypothetical protein
LLDALKHIAGLVLICKVETAEVEVSTPQADGGGLAGRSGSGSQGAEGDDRVGDPELAGLYGNTFGLVLAGHWGEVREDKVVRSEVEGAINLLPMPSQGHIVNLNNRERGSVSD